eukprot:scaffold107964_cov59-Phaeocystis_antarctica.AAC.1
MIPRTFDFFAPAHVGADLVHVHAHAHARAGPITSARTHHTPTDATSTVHVETKPATCGGPVTHPSSRGSRRARSGPPGGGRGARSNKASLNSRSSSALGSIGAQAIERPLFGIQAARALPSGPAGSPAPAGGPLKQRVGRVGCCEPGRFDHAVGASARRPASSRSRVRCTRPSVGSPSPEPPPWLERVRRRKRSRCGSRSYLAAARSSVGASSGESACRNILSKAEPTASPPPSASRRSTSERQPSSSASASCRWAAELGPPPTLPDGPPAAGGVAPAEIVTISVAAGSQWPCLVAAAAATAAAAARARRCGRGDAAASGMSNAS